MTSLLPAILWMYPEASGSHWCGGVSILRVLETIVERW
jgi:hypothetical protein